MGRETQRVVDTYDRTAEAQKIAAGAQNAVAAAAALEVGAIGLGALITAIATTVAMDVTGILLASFVAALGFFIIPARRRRAKNEMHNKISAMRVDLIEALRNQFKGEIERSIHNINEAIAPYTRFVRAERAKLQEAQSSLNGLKMDYGRVTAQVEALTEK